MTNIERINPNVALSELLINKQGFMSEELKRKLIERIFKDSRVKVESVLAAVKDFISVNANIDDDIDKYLDFVRDKGKVEELRMIVGNEYINKNKKILKYIYDYLDNYIDFSLPKIVRLLEEKQLSKLQQDTVLIFIKNM